MRVGRGCEKEPPTGVEDDGNAYTNEIQKKIATALADPEIPSAARGKLTYSSTMNACACVRFFFCVCVCAPSTHPAGVPACVCVPACVRARAVITSNVM